MLALDFILEWSNIVSPAGAISSVGFIKYTNRKITNSWQMCSTLCNNCLVFLVVFWYSETFLERNVCF